MKNLSGIKIDAGKLVKARGQLTHAQVAAAVGVSSQHLWNMEKGRSKPSADVLLRLCLLYGLDCRSLANVQASQ